MANFNIDGLNDLIMQLNQLDDIDEVAVEMLNEAAPILENSLKSAINVSADRNYSLGDLEDSVKAGKPRKNQYGYYVVVGPTGVDRKGVRNAEKLAYLNNGTSRQLARPVMIKAKVNAENGVLEKMQEVFDRRMNA